MEVDNNKPDIDKSREPIDSSQLSCVDNISRDKSVSRMANNSPADGSQCVLWTYSLGLEIRTTLCIREIQENSIEFQVQSSLPYILIPMVRANYCASYPKWPW